MSNPPVPVRSAVHAVVVDARDCCNLFLSEVFLLTRSFVHRIHLDFQFFKDESNSTQKICRLGDNIVQENAIETLLCHGAIFIAAGHSELHCFLFGLPQYHSTDYWGIVNRVTVILLVWDTGL